MSVDELSYNIGGAGLLARFLTVSLARVYLGSVVHLIFFFFDTGDVVLRLSDLWAAIVSADLRAHNRLGRASSSVSTAKLLSGVGATFFS